MAKRKAWTRWSDKDRQRLFDLVEQGVNWDDIAEKMGHGRSACNQQYRLHGPKDRPRKVRTPRGTGLEAMPPPPPPKVAVQAPPGPVSARRVSTAILIADAELRSRIAVQGLTRGLAGDPMPGRSALDRKLAGIPDEPDTSDHRTAYYANAPKITLAGETTR